MTGPGASGAGHQLAAKRFAEQKRASAVIFYYGACKYANELDSTGAVMAKVASTPGSIGYVSLDVVDDTVKAVKLDDVEPTEENIKAGSYFLSRPFVMATKGEISEQNELVQALFDYVYSAEGDDLIKSVGLITTK